MPNYCDCIAHVTHHPYLHCVKMAEEQTQT